MLINALLDQRGFRDQARHVAAAQDQSAAAAALVAGGFRGKGRKIITEILLRVAEEPEIRHAALVIGARAHTVDDAGARWVVSLDKADDVVFFEDGEDEARELARATGGEMGR